MSDHACDGPEMPVGLKITLALFSVFAVVVSCGALYLLGVRP